MKKRLAYILVFLFFLPNWFAFANGKQDSLTGIINKKNEDTATVKAYIELSKIRLNEDYQKSIDLAKKALSIAKKIQNDKFIGKSYASISYCNLMYGYSKEAIENSKIAIQYLQKNPSFENDVARQYNNIGNAYTSLGKYNDALENFAISKKISEKIGDRKGVAGVYNNIGNIFSLQKQPNKAREYFLIAKSMNIAIDNKPWLGINLMNIGISYYDVANYDSAEYYFFRSKRIFEEVKDVFNLSNALGNLGNANSAKKDYKKALSYIQKSIDLNKQMQNDASNTLLYSNLSSNYLHLNNISKAKEAIDSAFYLAKKKDDRPNLAQVYLGFSNYYKKIGEYKNSYEYYVKFTNLKDSLNNSETQDKMEKMDDNFKQDSRQKELELLTEKNKVQQMSLNKGRIIAYASLIGTILLLLIIFMIYKRYQMKQKANIALEDRNSEIEVQKTIIEEKNKDISDSIYYARQIQRTLLPSRNEIDNVFADYFILYKPKNIVSGDFYWFANRGKRVMIAAADCTGHGVPGAFMSMIGIEKLNLSILDIGITKASDIIATVNMHVKSALKQDADHSSSRDGMDIALCSFDIQNMKLEFSGANRPLCIVRGEKMLEFSSTKSAIGGLTSDRQEFINHEIDLQKDDIIYLFSDGYADQFGGPKGKKMMTKNFKSILLSLKEKKMSEQQKILDQQFNDWKGNLEQVDDILVIGIRI